MRQLLAQKCPNIRLVVAHPTMVPQQYLYMNTILMFQNFQGYNQVALGYQKEVEP
jgi:hypothetical protein